VSTVLEWCAARSLSATELLTDLEVGGGGKNTGRGQKWLIRSMQEMGGKRAESGATGDWTILAKTQAGRGKGHGRVGGVLGLRSGSGAGGAVWG